MASRISFKSSIRETAKNKFGIPPCSYICEKCSRHFIFSQIPSGLRKEAKTIRMKRLELLFMTLSMLGVVEIAAQCSVQADAGADKSYLPCCAPPTIGGNPTGLASGCPCTLWTYSWSPSTGLSSTTVANPTASSTVTTTYTVTVTHQTCGSATDAVTVTYRPDLSCCRIGDILEAPTIPNSDITIFPNPSGGEFNLKLHASNEFKSVRVYNSVGELIQEQTAKEGVVSIDIRNQSNGLYFIQVVCGDKVLLFDKVLKE